MQAHFSWRPHSRYSRSVRRPRIRRSPTLARAFVLRGQKYEERVLLASVRDWRNPVIAEDVDNSGFISASDLLPIGGYLRLHGPGQTLQGPNNTQTYLDVDGSGGVTNNDLLRVVLPLREGLQFARPEFDLPAQEVTLTAADRFITGRVRSGGQAETRLVGRMDQGPLFAILLDAAGAFSFDLTQIPAAVPSGRHTLDLFAQAQGGPLDHARISLLTPPRISTSALLLGFDGGLEDWTTHEFGGSAEGRGSVTDGSAILREGDSFVVALERPFVVPPGATSLQFSFTELSFDFADPDSINDAFEAALLDEHGRTLAHTIGAGRDAFFNITEDQSVALGTGAEISGDEVQTVVLDLSGVHAGAQAKLVFRLVNNDRDTTTSVKILDVLIPGEVQAALTAGFRFDPAPAASGPKVAPVISGAYGPGIAAGDGVTGRIAWGDGATQDLPLTFIGGEAKFSLPHLYAQAGVYTATVTIFDDGEEAASTSFTYGVARMDVTRDIDLTRGGSVPVLVMRDAGFDATKLDAATLRFGPGGATPANNVLQVRPQDVRANFSIPASGIRPTDTYALLTGNLLNGTPFAALDPIAVISAAGTNTSNQTSVQSATLATNSVTPNNGNAPPAAPLALASQSPPAATVASASLSILSPDIGQQTQTAAVSAQWVSLEDSYLDANERLVFTTQEDFLRGELFNVNAVIAPGELQLNPAAETEILPLIWIANTNEGSLSKFDTRTGKELGRYRTGPNSLGGALSPSRTAVNADGSVWVANRAFELQGSILHVLHDGFVDRNGNGVADTSQDTNGDGRISGTELLPWDANNDGQPDDERIARVISVGRNRTAPFLLRTDGVPRAISVDADDNVWVGLYNLRQYEVYDHETGQLLGIIPTSGTPYGAVIDASGTLFSATRAPFVDKIDTNARTYLGSITHGGDNYGITIDPDGAVWTTTHSASDLVRIDPATGAVNHYRAQGGEGFFRGVGVDQHGNVWAASNNLHGLVRFSFADDGQTLLRTQRVSVGNLPSAAVFDTDGYLWTTTFGDNQAWKIDPQTMTVVPGWPVPTGPTPYNYSDMTGAVRLTATERSGHWIEVIDGLRNAVQWSSVLAMANTPQNTSLRLRVRAGDDRTTLAAVPWRTVASAEFLAGVQGRFLEVEATLESTDRDADPRLMELIVEAVPPPQVAVTYPHVNDHLPPGEILLSGAATAGRPVSPPAGFANEIVSVTVNGQSVEVLDTRGAFFTHVNVLPGQNTFHVLAADRFGQTASTEIIVTGAGPGEIDFLNFADVSASFQGEYGRTAFNEDTNVLYADLAVRNTGTYAADTPLLVGVTNISDPSVRVREPDGLTLAGMPYYDFTHLVAAGTLAPSQQTDLRTIAFHNPNRIQFTYDLVFFGHLNQAPVITTIPQIEALAGRPYQYDADALDPDGDATSFSLVSAPSAMTINPTTGDIAWNPAPADSGVHSIILHVSDNRGGIAEQHYALTVTDPPPNRPPVFTSVPITQATVSAEPAGSFEITSSTNDIRLSNSAQASINPTLVVDQNEQVHIVYDEGPHHGSGWMDDIYYARVGPDGTVTVPSKPLNLPGWNGYPTLVSKAGEGVHLAWQAWGLAPGEEVFHTLLSPNGTAQGVTKVTNTPSRLNTDLPHLVAGQGDALYLVYQDEVNDPIDGGTNRRNDIFFQKLRLVGTTVQLVGPRVEVTTAEGVGSPNVGYVNNLGSIAVDAQDRVHIVWADWRNSANPNQTAIYYERVDNIGQTVIDEMPLSPVNQAVAGPPLVEVDSSGIAHVLWTELRGTTSVLVQARIDEDGRVIDRRDLISAPQDGISSMSFALDDDDRLHVLRMDASGIGSRMIYQRFDQFGNLLVGSLQVTQSTGIASLNGYYRSIDVAPDGRVTVVWTDTRNGNQEVYLKSFVVNELSAPTYRYDADAIDPDSDPILYSLVAGPDGMQIDPTNGLLTWAPSADQLGTHSVTVAASDGRGGTASQEYVIDVAAEPGNHPPVIVSEPVATAALSETYHYDVDALDPDGDVLAYALVEKPDGMTIDTDSGLISWQVPGDVPTFGFGAAMGSPGRDDGRDVATDSQGNVYLVGFISGTVDFDPSPATKFLSPTASTLAYVAKYSPRGDLLWLRSPQGAFTSSALSVAVDVHDNVFVAGLVSGAADFDPGPGEAVLYPTGGRGAFIWKLDSAGTFHWVRGTGGAPSQLEHVDIEVDRDGNLYLDVDFFGSIDVDPGSATLPLTSVNRRPADGSSNPGFDTALVKLDGAGNFLWARHFGDPRGYIEPNSHQIDPWGNVLISGRYQFTVDFDPGPGNQTFASSSQSEDIFVLKLNSQGDFVWVKPISAAGPQRGRQIDIDAAGNIAFISIFAGAVDYDPGPGTRLLSSDTSGYDGAVAKYDPEGNLLWAHRFQGADFDAAFSLAFDALGNVIAQGIFRGVADFDPGTGTYLLDAGASHLGAGPGRWYTVKLNSAGDFVWADATGGYSMAIDCFGHIYSTGIYYNTYDFDGSTAVRQFTSAGAEDIFLTQITAAPSSADVTVRVEDGRGGIDEQSFIIDVRNAPPGEIHGMKFHDTDNDGARSGTFYVYDDFNRSDSLTVGNGFQEYGNTSIKNQTLIAPDLPGVGSGVFIEGLTFPKGEYRFSYEVSSDSSTILEPFITFGAEGTDARATGPAVFLVRGPFRTHNSNTTQLPVSVSIYGTTLRFDVPVAPANNQVIGISAVLFPDLSSQYTFDLNADGIDVVTVNQPSIAPAGDFLPGPNFVFGNHTGQPNVITTFDNLSASVLEPGLPDWIIYLDENRNGVRDSSERFTTTDSRGNYFFRDLAPGEYVVREELQSGWVQTAPTGGSHTVTVTSGEVVTGIDFGNQESNKPQANRGPSVTTTPSDATTVGQLFRYDADATDPDGDALQFDLVVKPVGMVVHPTTGVVVWTPTSDQEGSHDIVLRVQDGRGGVALQPFQITVSRANTGPVITSRPRGPAVVGLPYQYQVVAQDTDGDAIAFELGVAPAGMAIDGGTGLVTWTPAAGQVGLQHVEVTASDGRGAETTQSFELPVVATAPNDPPQIISVPRSSVRLGNTYTYQVMASDPNGDPLSYSLDTRPAGMLIDAAGLVTWTATEAQLGSHDVAVRVEDGRGESVVQSFQVSVITVVANRAPQIISTPPFAATVGQEYAYDLRADDPDGDPLGWSLDAAPAGMSIHPTQGTLRWTPATDQIGAQAVVVRVFDDRGGFATQSFSIAVRSVNVPPNVTSTPKTTAAVNALYTYAVRAVDPENHPLQFVLASGPAGMALDENTGLIAWTPSAAQVGPHDVSLRVEDSEGGVATQTYHVVVTATANRAPAINSTPPFVATVGAPYEYPIEASDPDGDSLSYSLFVSPIGMNINPTTGRILWTPLATQLGEHEIQVAAIDPQGAGGTQTYTVTVLDNNRNPLIDSQPPPSVTAGLAYRYDVRASDPDGDPLRYTLDQGPPGLLLDQLGRITWSPQIADIGVHRVAITVADHRGGAVTQSYDLAVQADTQAPRVNLFISSNPVALNAPVTFVGAATDNVAVTSLILTINGNAVPLDANGRVTLVAKPVGQYAVELRALDAAGNLGHIATTLSVIDTSDQDAPVVDVTSPADGAVLTAPIDVIGTASDANLASYVVEVAPREGGAFVEMFRGTTSVVNGVLGRLDPTTLANGGYRLRLSAADTNGNHSSIESTFEVAGDLKIGNFTLSFTDLSIPISGIPITVTRTYDTLNAAVRDEFGYGWRLEFRDTDLRTSLLPSGTEELGIYPPYHHGVKVYVTVPGGRREGFTFRPRLQSGFGSFVGFHDPVFVPDAGVTSQLSVPAATLIVGADGHIYGANGLA